MDVDRVQGFLFSKPLNKEDFLLLTLNDKAPVLDPDSLLKRQGTFSSFNLLVRAIKDEYPLILFGNISKNSYYVMYLKSSVPYTGDTAGIYDEMISNSIKLCVGNSKKIYEAAFNRTSLIDSYLAGRTRVEATIDMEVAPEMIFKFNITVHLLSHPSNDDILMVGWSKPVEE